VRPAQGGQALVEAALTIPILLVLLLGFYTAGLAVQGFVDLGTAVSLAAASAASAPADDPATATAYASQTFDHTVQHFPLLRAPSLSCPGDFRPGAAVTCTGSALLSLSDTPLGLVSGDIRITRTAVAQSSPYRARGSP
jgi:hypothetical protein